MCSIGMTPPDGPPICTDLKDFPFGGPPPMSNTTWPNGVPTGTSAMPELVILPTRQNVLVPEFPPTPMPLYQSAPFNTIWGTMDQVSTLLSVVGLSNNPLLAGNGGLWRGLPRFPSIDISSAVSSPQTKAPAPGKISRSKLKLVPRMFWPSRPYCLACFRA